MLVFNIKQVDLEYILRRMKNLASQALASLYVVRQYIASSTGKQPLEWLKHATLIQTKN